jgi:hypothetical protein
MDRRTFSKTVVTAGLIGIAPKFSNSEEYIPLRDKIDLKKKVQAAPLPKIPTTAPAPLRLTDSISQLLWEAGCGKDSSIDKLTQVLQDVVNVKFNDNEIFDIFHTSSASYFPLVGYESNGFKPQYYEMYHSADMLQKYLKDARVDVFMRMVDILANSIIKKVKDDAWHILISSGVDRNTVFYDEYARHNGFSKRLVSLMKTGMRRNGNNVLTDLYISPEAIEATSNLYVESGLITRLFGVNLHSLEELGVKQEYQNFFENELKGTLPTGSNQICVGLDLSKGLASPFQISRPAHLPKWEVFHNPELMRERRLGFDLKGQIGIACIDNQAVLLGSHS